MIDKSFVGKEVWFKSTWVDINSGIVMDWKTGEDEYAKVAGTRDTYGTQWVKAENCFKSKRVLLDSLKSHKDEKINTILSQLSTVEDLVRYMYNHTVSCAEEYTDWEAREAVAIAAKKLLGVDLNNK